VRSRNLARAGGLRVRLPAQQGTAALITAAILTGGQARRLGGRDKSRLLVGGETILARQLRALTPVASEILLVGRADARGRLAGLTPVADARPGTGTLGGIYSALLAAHADTVLVVGCDMPFLTAPFLRRVIEESDGVDVAMPRTPDGWQPLCAAYRRGCEERIRRHLDAGRYRVVDMIPDLTVREIGPAVVATFDPHGDLLMNINTAADLARSRSHARRLRRAP
jgi:molybdopterin-guanine dinucleotide biosynthesis protein A